MGTELVIFWLLLSMAVGILADRYRRAGVGWFLFSLALSPLLGFIFVLAAGPRPRQSPTMRDG